MSMKNSNDTIGNRTRDLPTCSEVTQPTARPRTPNESRVELHLYGLIGTTSRPDMLKIQIIGFFFENRLRWQFEVENMF
jgi:hypothetical protein